MEIATAIAITPTAFLFNGVAVKQAGSATRTARLIRREAIATTTVASNSVWATISPPHTPKSNPFKQLMVSIPPFPLSRQLRFRPSPELGLLSLLLVLSMATGAIFSLALISIPTLAAFKGLANSVDKLLKVVAEEVPGTISSLKLSGLEITDLTEQLTNIR